jgi:hypothetical protein
MYSEYKKEDQEILQTSGKEKEDNAKESEVIQLTWNQLRARRNFLTDHPNENSNL